MSVSYTHLADMGVAAFMKKDLGVAIQYETDSQQHIFIKKMEMQGPVSYTHLLSGRNAVSYMDLQRKRRDRK